MKKKVLSILTLVIISCVCLFTLTACENSDNGGDTPPTHEHSFTNYISDNNATCTVNGTETATCDNCDATDTREIADSKLAHSFTNYISDNNATYEVDGTKTAVCNRNGCNETDTITDNGSKLQSYFGFNLGYTINSRKAYIKVCSTTKTIYFPDEIVLKGNDIIFRVWAYLCKRD